MKFKITQEQSGERIDKFLAGQMPDFSRSQIQKMIRSENIMVNGKAVSVHYFLKEGDIITKHKTQNIEQKVNSADDKKLKAKNYKLKIIADTNEYIIINKPAGIAMHGAPHMNEITLIDLILKKYPKIKKVGEDPARPGIMHRIDKEVSGLVAIAKTEDSYNNLKKQFQERTIKKEYTALVFGQIKKDEDRIDFPISRANSGHKMAALPKTIKGEENIKGRIAITEFKIEKKFINYTLLKVKIKTGRTHQIRAHMAAYGHPIVGDNLYSTKKTREQNKKINLGRIFLFADKLSFKDLSGERKTFKIEMPGELKELLGKIK
jgi:23S rRNA pseudouridine1911/1915/1917 synthase